MDFLRITAVDGTRQYISESYVLSIGTTADGADAGSNYSAPKVTRGRINQVKYYDGANTTAGAIVVASVSAYASGGTLYEYGCLTNDGAFSVYLRN